MKRPVLILLFLAFAKLLSAQQTPDTSTKQKGDMNIEQAASFAGRGSIADFITNNVQYPVNAYKNHIEGKVLVSFTITSNGGVNKIKVIKPVSAELDSEAVRVVRLMKWYPAKKNGQPISEYFAIPFNFTLSQSKR